MTKEGKGYQHHWHMVGENDKSQFEWCECGALRVVDIATREVLSYSKPAKHPRCKERR